jgi:hypothetical protein
MTIDPANIRGTGSAITGVANTDTPAEPVFASKAPPMHRAGFAVLPAHGKEPIRKGYRNWCQAPGAGTVARWADKDPDADIVYVPGLSRVKSGGSGIVVVDADDELACERVIETFRDTPGKVRTRRGRHFQYRDAGLDFRKLSSLKAFGINADVKHGNSIVVAPWSRHQKDRRFIYAWDGCDETVIRDLPPFNGQALQRLIDNSRPAQVEGLMAQSGTQMGPALRDGSRKLGLNDRLVAIVWSCSSESELLEKAFKINNEIGRSDPRGPRTVDQVMAVARAVWRDRETGKIEKWSGVSNRDKHRRIVAERLSLLDPKAAPLAYMLIERLVDEHGARCRCGETFMLSVRAMAEAQVIPGWSWRQYTRARNLLLKAGLIELVSEYVDTAEGRVAAQYRLATFILYPGARGGGQV